jgi:hypothetical protein
MKRIYSAPSIAMVGHLKNVLEIYGIETELRNEYPGGQLPPIECWPELWVDDDREMEASKVVTEALAEQERQADPWTCAHCGEEVEGSFAECWNCRRARPNGSPDA